MKKLIFLFLIYIVNACFAMDGIVIVLEAPLLAAPSLTARVLQTTRKGSRVFIPNEYKKMIEQEDKIPEFFQTFDRTGNIAFIPSRYVKVVTNTLSENRMPVNYPGVDPTDYRIEEPISKTYPFDDSTFLRGTVAFSVGNNINAPYRYNTAYERQDLSTDKGLKIAVTRKISFDLYDRYYFGLIGGISTVNNELKFENLSNVHENRSMLRLGPIITFDPYKTESIRLTAGTGFTYNYHRSALTMEDLAGNREERLFSGYSLSPFVTTMLQISNVFPLVDFVAGADVSLFLPHSQKSNEAVSIPELWQNSSDNSIKTGLEPQVALFLGLQVRR